MRSWFGFADNRYWYCGSTTLGPTTPHQCWTYTWLAVLVCDSGSTAFYSFYISRSHLLGQIPFLLETMRANPLWAIWKVTGEQLYNWALSKVGADECMCAFRAVQFERECEIACVCSGSGAV